MAEMGIEVHMRVLNEYRANVAARMIYGAIGCDKIPQLLGGVVVFEAIWDGAAVYVLFAANSRIFVAEVYAPNPAHIVSIYREIDDAKAHVARLPWIPKSHLGEINLAIEKQAAELHRPLTGVNW